MLLKWRIFTCLAVIWLRHGNCHSPILVHLYYFSLCSHISLQPKYILGFVIIFLHVSFTLFNRNEWSTIPKNIFCMIRHDAIDLSTYLYFFVCFLVLIHKFLTFWTRPLSINISLFTTFFSILAYLAQIFFLPFFPPPDLHFCFSYGLWKSTCYPQLQFSLAVWLAQFSTAITLRFAKQL